MKVHAWIDTLPAAMDVSVTLSGPAFPHGFGDAGRVICEIGSQGNRQRVAIYTVGRLRSIVVRAR